MEKSGYFYRGYTTYSTRPSLPFVPNQTDNLMGRTSRESSLEPFSTVEEYGSLNPLKDGEKWHQNTSTIYGGPVEELTSKIMDMFNQHSKISPSNAAVNVPRQPHESGSPTQVCDGDHCYYTSKGGPQPIEHDYVGNEKIADYDTAVDHCKTADTGSWARPADRTWAANPVYLVKLGQPVTNVGEAAPPNFGLQSNPTARGDHYTHQSGKNPAVNSRQDTYDDYDSKGGQLANIPSVPNTGGSNRPNHVTPSSLQGRVSQPIEPTDRAFKVMEPNKEAAKPVSPSTSRSTGLYGATSRGDQYLNQKQRGPIAQINPNPQHDSHHVNDLKNDSGRKPAREIIGGYPMPTHVTGASLPTHRAQLGESPNCQRSGLESHKEYRKPTPVTAALPMGLNNAAGPKVMQSNKPQAQIDSQDDCHQSNALEPNSFASANSARPNYARRGAVPIDNDTDGMSQATNNNGKLKEVAAVRPTGLNSTVEHNRHGDFVNVEERKPVGNKSWGDNNNETQNKRHGPPPPASASLPNNGVWAKTSPPRGVSLAATGTQVGEPVKGSKALEQLSGAAKSTGGPAAPSQPKYNLLSSAAQNKEPSAKTIDSREAQRKYGKFDPSSKVHVNTKETNTGIIDCRDAAKKYNGILLPNND